MITQRVRCCAIAASFFCLVPQMMLAQEPRPLRKPTPAEDLQLFSQVLNQIRVNHPDSIDTHVLFMAAIQGMVRAADPHSYVIPAMRFNSEKEEALRKGNVVPVPINFTLVRGRAVVASVAAGSRAAQQDILPGDELVAINDQPVTQSSEAELDVTLAGAKKSTVALTFSRYRIDGSRVQLRRLVMREVVEDETAIPVAFMLDPQTGYTRVTTFAAEKIANDLNDSIERLEKQGMKQLILDLRDNGGGIVDEASRVAGVFLPAGAVVYTVDRIRNEPPRTGKVERAFWKHERRFPVIVLVNNGTASAAELVAAALQDNDRALIVGEPSFGKALMMRYMPLSDGSLLALVIGHVKTPCGRVLQRQYRNIRAVDYYREAGAQLDTAERPTCKSKGGRPLYGGGGVYPDVLLPDTVNAPLWMSRLQETDLVTKWAAAYVSTPGAGPQSLDELLAKGLPETAIDQFRTFAARERFTVPEGAEVTGTLGPALLRAVAYARWGNEGYYRAAAFTDFEVKSATQHFDQARRLSY